MDRFTLDEALELLPEARRRIAEIAGMTADLQRRARDLREGEAERGAIPEAKSLEAHIDEELGWFRERGVQVKGIAPALLDFPARATIEGEPQEVLLCWREGEETITHFHAPDAGYLGRTPVAAADEI